MVYGFLQITSGSFQQTSGGRRYRGGGVKICG
jgi:hypothetical protein